jgi:hypothetical protein
LSESDFQRHVIDSLGRLETKMDTLVGLDGNGGRVESIDGRIRSLERHNWRQSGFFSAIGAIIGVAVSALVSCLRHL